MTHWCYIFPNSNPKPSTPNPQLLNPKPPPPKSNSHPQTPEPQAQTPLSNSKPPPQYWKNVPFLPTFSFVPLLPVPFLLDTTHNTSTGENFKSSFIDELSTNSIKSFCNSSENFSTKRCNGSRVKLRI